ncbi:MULTISPECIES: hypothetical protein [unclassified Anabaena]|uniref:hypothetical protein n=1 Tax=unclassified Anabaena TaxID=2619674 RepID=UPI0039C5AD32
MLKKGTISGRPFDPSKAGGKILGLSYTKVKITGKGTDIVEAHICRFNPVGHEEMKMVERLRKIAADELVAEAVDLRFYTHELREYLRYKKLKYPSGQPDDPDAAYELWNNGIMLTQQH